MTLSTVTVSLDGITALVALDPQSAPMTCAALDSLLPVTTTAHYAKIAGHEFYLHLPLFLEVEHLRRVSDLTPGTVAFWPERQLLCIYYGHIQDEDAAVTALGRVVENLSGLAKTAEAMRERLGRVIPTVRLSRGSGGAPHRAAHRAFPDGTRSGAAGAVFEAYASIRDVAPPEVEALIRRTGVMQPAGALICAEGDTRKLHEFTWLVREEIRTTGTVPEFTGRVLHHWAGRLRGWYGLAAAGALVSEVAAALPAAEAHDAQDLIEGLTLYAGRLSLWLDAYIPWERINRLLHQTPVGVDAGPGRGGDA